MDQQATPISPKHARKKSRAPEKWQRNVAKRLRYASHGLPIAPDCDHNTKKHKCASLRMCDLLNFQKAFFKTSDKLKQDALLLKCCTPKKIRKIKTLNRVRKPKQFTIHYHIAVNKNLIPVCQKTFLGTLNIKKCRVEYVMKFFFHNTLAPVENRGGNHKSHIYNQKRDAVQDFINGFKVSEPHYCRGSSHSRTYLSSDLCINKMYRMFIDKTRNFSVKRSYFRTIFNRHYNIGFGKPRTDVCSTCIEFGEKLKIETNNSKRNDLMINQRVHKLRAKAFYQSLKEKKPDMKTFSFDCEKNLPLPKVPDQSCYYSRQLYLNNFTIVEGSSNDELNTRNVFSYVWTEDLFKKGSNEIASAIFDRLNKSDLAGIHHVRLVSDGCAGQNKNTTILGMLSKWLLEKPSIKKVELVFPVTGHSFMPPDRVFGNIEKNIRQKEVIMLPHEYKDIIKDHATVTNLENIEVYDWKSSVQSVMKPCGSLHFKVKLCKRFILKRSKKPGNFLIRGEPYYKFDYGQYKSVCKTGMKTSMMIQNSIQPSQTTVNSAKLVDVNNLLKNHYGDEWKTLENLQFYAKVLSSVIPENDRSESPNENDTDEDICEAQDEPSFLVV